MGQALGVKMELDERCKYAEFDRYFSEVICRKYGMPCRICCVTCWEPEINED